MHMQMVASTACHVDTTMVKRRYLHLRTGDVVNEFKRYEENNQEFVAKMKHNIAELGREKCCKSTN